ncbi:uncharacterized protein LOC120209549 [Hibiscus syriacus]|uniref:uncharacterized protein LOC120209549 n=1 Tax=Hibiscus syriacus TaxID=106335 RepID=UPI001921D27D|nr:uncharacterized protein LOC120209549 [Hibiscus syriacus]
MEISLGLKSWASLQLERPGSLFPDEDQRETKKVRNKEKVDRMEEDRAVMEAQSNTDTIDTAANNDGLYPVNQFVDQVHDRIDYCMRRSVIVWLLERAIGYKTLLNRIGVLWQLQGQYQFIDLENDYFLVEFESEQDYIHVLMEEPWIIFGSYLTVQPWSCTFSTVVKIDYSTNSGERGRFTRLAVLMNLNKPLIPCLKIDGFWKKIEYEGLQQICFQCGVYGHSKENYGSVKGNTRQEGLVNEPSAVLDKSLSSEETGFGPWMIAETRKRRSKKIADQNPEGGRDKTRGSRFTMLNKINNGHEENTAAISEVPDEDNNMRNGEVYAPRMEYQAKGKDVMDSVPKEEGATSQVTQNQQVIAGGSHSAITISNDSRNNIIKRSNYSKGIQRDVGDDNKGLKGKKNKDFIFSPAVLEDWLKIAKYNTKHDKVTLHKEGSSIPRGNEKEETFPPIVESVIIVPEEDIPLERDNGTGSPNFRRYLQEHCQKSRLELVTLFETRISGVTTDKVIRTLGFQNSFRVEEHGFSGGIWILCKDGLNVEISTISNQFIHGSLTRGKFVVIKIENSMGSSW